MTRGGTTGVTLWFVASTGTNECLNATIRHSWIDAEDAAHRRDWLGSCFVRDLSDSIEMGVLSLVPQSARVGS